MNVQRLNPFGYTATTENGNQYKATNRATAGFLAVTAAELTALPLAKRAIKNPIVKNVLNGFSPNKMMQDSFEQIFGRKFSAKQAKIAGAAGLAIGIVGDVLLGHWLDNRTNKKRAAKADALAQEQAAKVADDSANIDEEA